MAVTGILGKKIGMTQLFDDRGDVHPVTVLKAGPCVITQLKTLAKDGYDAAQIGYVDFIKASKVNKAHDRALRQVERAAGAHDQGSSGRDRDQARSEGDERRSQGRRSRDGRYLLR